MKSLLTYVIPSYKDLLIIKTFSCDGKWSFRSDCCKALELETNEISVQNMQPSSIICKSVC